MALTLAGLVLASTACTGSGDTTQIRSKSPTTASGAGGAGGGDGGGGQGGGDGFMTTSTPLISKSQGGVAETESTVAVGDNGLVAAAWIGLTTTAVDVGYSFSKDGGQTWTAPAVASPNDGRQYGDPTLVTAHDGSIYLAFIGFRYSGSEVVDSHIFVSKAEPGATTFGPPVEASDPAVDHPWDKPVATVTTAGTILVSFTDTATGILYVARSVDGVSFTRAAAVDDGDYAALGYPCAGSDGRVWLVYRGLKTIGMRRSDDDGASWPVANAAVASDSTEHDLSTDDPTCVAFGSEVWVAYARSTDSTDPSTYLYKDYAIRIAHSNDGGMTIDRRVDALDASAAKYAMNPALVREPGGALDVAYYAGAMNGDKAGTFRVTRSTDDAQTFAPSEALAQPILFTVNRLSKAWIGDYSGVVAQGNALYVTYSDNASGAAHVSFVHATHE